MPDNIRYRFWIWVIRSVFNFSNWIFGVESNFDETFLKVSKGDE